jgi:hypothetical protein
MTTTAGFAVIHSIGVKIRQLIKNGIDLDFSTVRSSKDGLFIACDVYLREIYQFFNEGLLSRYKGVYIEPSVGGFVICSYASRVRRFSDILISVNMKDNMEIYKKTGKVSIVTLTLLDLKLGILDPSNYGLPFPVKNKYDSQTELEKSVEQILLGYSF